MLTKSGCYSIKLLEVRRGASGQRVTGQAGTLIMLAGVPSPLDMFCCPRQLLVHRNLPPHLKAKSPVALINHKQF